MSIFVGLRPGQRRQCRRQQISRHFGEAIPECRGGCDVCAAEVRGTGWGQGGALQGELSQLLQGKWWFNGGLMGLMGLMGTNTSV